MYLIETKIDKAKEIPRFNPKYSFIDELKQMVKYNKNL